MSKIIQTFPAGGGDSSNETISKTDFDALTQEEKDNGTAYYIPDADIVTDFTVMGNRFDRANIYTEDERMVGSYLGKPLYQKVVTGLNVTITAQQYSDVPVNISDMEFVINCTLKRKNVNLLYYPSRFQPNGTSVRIMCDDTDTVDAIIFQYTKTTDATVNIGTGNDYSTDEQIIGTWVDGKSLYQKTISCGGLKNNDVLSVNHNIANIDKIFIAGGFALNSSGNSIPISFYDVLYPQYSVRPTVNKTQINIRTTQDMSEYAESYVILQYTKTED